VTCRKSRLYHSGAVAQRLMDALLLKVPGVIPTGGTADDETEGAAEQLFVVRLFRDQLVLSADSSGELLHRRGYRQATAKAPLRETLAAAMVMGAGWTGTTPLIDPMCGAGTIAIEAAMIARRMAPGLHRKFAFEHWPGFDAALWKEVRDEAKSAVLKSASVPILASDRDPGAVEAAISNAARAGVTADLQISQASLSAVAPPKGPGLVVLNPPYGIRVGDKKPLRNLFAQLGNVLRAGAGGWRLGMLSADHDLDRQVQLKFHEQWKSSNGGIPVRFITAEVPVDGE
jgi:putative N6-adenine-specific DNA methylase